jgi:alginate O-acetyltransferase complex protein AlgI
MVFASIEFLTLFLPLFLLCYACTPAKWRNVTLMVGSALFYAWWTPKFLLLIVALTLWTWYAALSIERSASEVTKTRWMIATIVINLGSLIWYKYTNIVVKTVLASSESSSVVAQFLSDWQPILLPIGLSFTVLHAISYIVDVRRAEIQAQPSMVAFSAYMLMFPHLIAGPIVRFKVIAQEINQRVLSWANVGTGVRYFMIGFSMKVLLADALAPLVQIVFHQLHELNVAPSLTDAWIGCSAYTLQLYFDFAGYSAMAIGLGRILGFHFEPNFNHPYLAGSIQDFWRRWHMTLSSWLRDYLYISLGGNRHGALRKYMALMLTMAIGGLWHGGDSWNFLLWGIVHGSALCIHAGYRNYVQQGGWQMPRVLAHTLTLLVVMLAWTLFRAENFAVATQVLAGQFGFNGVALHPNVALAIHPMVIATALMGIVCVIYPAWVKTALGQQISQLAFWQTVGFYAPIITFMYAVMVLVNQTATPFLYFQF